MEYKYPRDAVAALYRASSPEVLGELFPIRTPRHLVEQMVEIAYHASFLTEEGRATRFQLALLSRDRVGSGSGETTVLEFKEPRPLTMVEVLRLAPAADFTTTLICVDAYNYIPGLAHRGLEIWGVVSPGTSSKRLVALQASEAVHAPRCLVVSSMAPGHIQLALNIRPLVILRSGKVTVIPRAVHGLPEPLLQLFEEGISSSTRAIIECDRFKSLVSVPLVATVENKYVEIFCRLLMHLSETCHGLTLLFISEADLASVEKVLSIKYSTNCRRIGLLFKEYILKRLESELSDPVLSRLDAQISEALTVISRTSAVDGALVISDQFNVVGFGAEIKANDVHVAELHFSYGQTKEKFSPRLVTDFGTRHRSAARFTKAVPGSIAFVVSQDGDRKIMSYVDGKVVVWSNVVWDRIWESLGV